MKCFLCELPIDGPAVPRFQEGSHDVVYLHPDCWEACAFCCTPMKVFEPAGDSRGEGLPLMFRDTVERSMVLLAGVAVNACTSCIEKSPSTTTTENPVRIES